MELLLKKRKPLRASFTRTFNGLVQELGEQEPKDDVVKSKLATLERLSTELTALDEEVCDALLQEGDSDEAFEHECTVVEEYKEKLDIARVKVETYLSSLLVRPDNNASISSSPTFSKRKLKLPKIELRKFTGEVKDWLGWWSQFSRIHEDNEMEDEDKFQYLLQAIVNGTRARELVESFPPTGENYPKAIESLKSRFGREELLIEFYVRELLGLVLKNATDNSKDKGSTAKLYDKLESYLRALESIGMTTDKYAAMLFPLVESCIPEDIFRVWLRNPVGTADGEFPEKSYSDKLKQLLSFLRNEVEGEERISLAKTGFKMTASSTSRKESGFRKQTQESVPTANDLFSAERSGGRLTCCVFCDKSHESRECFKAADLSLDHKQNILKKRKLCFTCFKPGHRSKCCKANVRCLVCSKRHWAILCPELRANRARNLVVEPNEEEKQNATLSSYCCTEEVLLQTLLVNLEENGQKRTVRALLDGGSQRSYILRKTAQDMNYKPVGSETLVHTLFGGLTSKKEVHNCYVVQLKALENDYSCRMRVLDQPIICGAISRLTPGPWMDEIEQNGIHLTDTGRGQPPIEILLGADVAGKLITGNIVKLQCGLVAMETLLGWVITGRMQKGPSQDNQVALLVTLLTHSNRVEDLWKLEAIGITDTCETRTDYEIETAALEHFERTVEVNSDGRYEIRLPWLENREYLPDNKAVAKKRLESATSKLHSHRRFEDYDAVLQEWEQEGIIEEVPMVELENNGHYLPHRPVFKPSSTTPVRPVFDASCKQKGFPSLNDCLAKGPNLLEKIPAVILKFREKNIGVTADVRKAFLQISLHRSDRDSLRFLWWKDRDRKEMKVFRHCRVVFGVNCSPFLLGAVINHHLKQYQQSLQNLAEKLRESFYVDNCLTSVDSKEELQSFVKRATQMMADAQFELRGWEHSEFEALNVKPEPSVVLGLLWDRQDDTLFCDVSGIDIPDGTLTRRSILSITQRVFDPIGFCCPVTLAPKLLLQESWKAKLSWDAEVPGDIKGKFLKWVEELPMLSLVQIPRCVRLSDSLDISLHTFCDASKMAYAAVVYLRCENEQQVFVQLLQAKSRVAPLKKITIPRLELMACCIGARLAAFVKKGLGINDIKEYFWTDSTTALSWIQRDEPWGTFVGNRTKEICNLSKAEDWRHVPGSDNPADLPSRGCTVKVLMESRWWEGPEWLKLQMANWPNMKYLANDEEVNKERKRGIVAMLTSNAPKEQWFLSYFSRYTRILRMVAWMLRFVNNIRKRITDREKGELTVRELTSAEKILVRTVQRDAFPLRDLSSLKTLCVFEDKEGILRVQTKITEREDAENFKYPMLLPSNHKLVELLIQEQHLMMHHAGTHILLSKLREDFWILKGRKTVRGILSRCIRCRRHESKGIAGTPVTLPVDRVRDASVFEVTGVDLAGPLVLKDGKKAWIILFTCAVYRAVHLELMPLSTKSFLLGLRRFIARRGRPNTVFSDNGSNFVGTDNLFRTIDWEAIEAEASIRRIQWRFNPPTAAWWGGFWERLIQIIKKLLRRTLGRASLCYEELMSILCDCEAIVNSRPLTYISEDTQTLTPLTPSMFLQDIPTVGVPDLDHLDAVDVNKRLRYQQRLREDLRKRFRREYLSQLVQRPAKKGSNADVKVGDVVLVESEDKRRTFWPMARVIDVYPGKDGCIRVVRLKTSTGEMVRPTQRIFPLEISTSLGALDERRKLNEVQPSAEELRETVITRSGRHVKIPSRFSH